MKRTLFFVFLFALFSFSFSKDFHPYHVGSVEIHYNKESQRFEISAKLFLDDLENTINKKYNKNLKFLNPRYKEEMNIYLKRYLEETLNIKVNGTILKLDFIGYEEDKESVNLYLESEAFASPKKVEANVSLLYEMFKEQLNIVHIIINGERKSTKMKYPDSYVYQLF